MADGKVTVIARIKAKPGLEETVKKEVMNLVSPTRSEAGSAKRLWTSTWRCPI
jgi:quinol monooxygenase YgiN